MGYPCLQLDGGVVGGSAVQCAVSAGPLAPMRCACEGPGLAAARCGEPASFTIAAADAFGNRRGGADDFVVSVACLDTGGAAPVAARVEDLGRGSYRARTMPGPEHMSLPAALVCVRLSNAKTLVMQHRGGRAWST